MVVLVVKVLHLGDLDEGKKREKKERKKNLSDLKGSTDFYECQHLGT